MTAVIILASFIMIVPQNLFHTISGDDFVTNIGVGKCDLRMDIQQTGQIPEKTGDIGRYMENDPDITDYAMFVSKIFQVRLDSGGTGNLRILTLISLLSIWKRAIMPYFRFNIHRAACLLRKMKLLFRPCARMKWRSMWAIRLPY